MDDFLTPLCGLAFKYGSDKCPQIKHHYTPFYYDFLFDIKEQIEKVLEIGVGGQSAMVWTNFKYTTGASLYMWRDFFPNAQIYGADIDETAIFETDRIKTFLCDQSKREDLLHLISIIGTDIDLVIDDGSHKPEDQILSCITLMPVLKKDVIYVIEDVGQSFIADKFMDKYKCEFPRLVHRSNKDDRLLIVRNRNV